MNPQEYQNWLKDWQVQYDKAPDSATKKALEGIRAQFEAQNQQYSPEGQIQQRYSDVTNFNSPLYQQYAQYLQKTNPQISTNALLSAPQAGGFNYGVSQKLATERAKQLNTSRNEAISQGAQQFALGNQSNANSLLGYLLNNNQFQQQLAEQKRQFNESQPSFLDSLLNIGGGLLGYGVGNLFSGKSFFGGAGTSGLNPLQGNSRYGY